MKEKKFSIKGALKKAKDKIFKKKPKLICSDKCRCAGNCNKGFSVVDIGNNFIEFFIDWGFSTEGPTAEDRNVSILIDRDFLLNNLLLSGKKLQTRETFDYALKQYVSEYLDEKNGVNGKRDLSKITIKDLAGWNGEKIKVQYTTSISDR